MFRFFRHIRLDLLEKNKTGRYLKYAIGEVILVVIGILIALQINNWNENRKLQIAQNTLLVNFYENLAADSIILQNHKRIMSNIIETQKQLHAFRKQLLGPEEINNPQNIRNSFRNYSITQSNHPDIATKIVNESLKEQIRDYYRLLAFLENAYGQYDNVVKESVRPYLANNLALNPDFLFDNQNQLDKPEKLNLLQFYLIVRREDFGQILFESHLKATETIGYLNEIIKANSALRVSIKNEIN